MNNLINKYNIEINKTVVYYKEYLYNLHFGKANLNLLKNIKIKINNIYYNIYDLANINLIDNITFKIIPYEKKNINKIKKELLFNKIGNTIFVKENAIILKLSLFTEEKRLELIKKIKIELEKNKNILRLIRNKYNNILKKELISDDEKNIIKKEIEKIYKINILYLNKIFKNKYIEILQL
ncbi:MAG: ribosome-recycling factor [Candidatus Shikimatogenerans bostrichidophilus]|nr:MAG: ribosome-recycling factor [Candidatus Shikimatogenerans bostrichidophilus]